MEERKSKRKQNQKVGEREREDNKKTVTKKSIELNY